MFKFSYVCKPPFQRAHQDLANVPLLPPLLPLPGRFATHVDNDKKVKSEVSRYSDQIANPKEKVYLGNTSQGTVFLGQISGTHAPGTASVTPYPGHTSHWYCYWMRKLVWYRVTHLTIGWENNDDFFPGWPAVIPPLVTHSSHLRYLLKWSILKIY